jgi:hypothetical protein
MDPCFVDGSAASGTTIAETGHGSDLNVDFIGRRALKLDGFFMSTNGADNEAALRYRREDREFAQSGEASITPSSTGTSSYWESLFKPEAGRIALRRIRQNWRRKFAEFPMEQL